MVHHRVGWLDHVFIGLSHAGSLGILWLCIAALAAILWRRPALVLLVVAADGLAEVAARVLKTIWDRPRPPLRYPEPEPLVHVPASGSFPSGHAATSFACALVLARTTRLPAWLLFALAAAVAWSRVYVGVHYPLDVLGGALLGLAVGALALAAARALRSRGGVLRRSPRARPPG